MSLETFQHPLQKLFNRDFQFEIPSFQRPYVWKIDEAIQLLDDLRSAMATPDIPYFLGSLVLVRKADDPREVIVIDGQQRLTTLTILLAALRHLEEDENFLTALNELILEPGNELAGIHAQPRLQLRNVDNAFFRSFIQEGDIDGLFQLEPQSLATPAQRRMWENLKVVLDELDEELGPSERRELAQYLSQRVNLVLVVSKDFDSAHRIFNVLNTRGVALSAGDILKSQMIGSVPASERDNFGERWDAALDPLENASDQFLRDLFEVITHREARSGIPSEYEHHVLPLFDGGSGMSFLEDYLEPYTRIAKDLQNGGNPAYSTAVNEQVRRLTEHPSGEWKPAAMWILRNYGTDEVGAHLLNGLDRAMGVEVLAKSSPSVRRARVSRLLVELSDHPKGSITKDTRLRYLAVDDALRRRAVTALHDEFAPRSPTTRLLLLRANDECSAETVDRPRAMSVLQVLPERSENNPSWENLSEATRVHWPRRLGNLALVQSSFTQPGKEAAFLDIKNAIATTRGAQRFPLTTGIREYKTWDRKTLARRQGEMIRLIAGGWDIRFDSDGVDLTSLSLDRLTLASGGMGASRGRRVTLAEVQEKGLLHTGDRFIWDRPQLGVTHEVTLTENGQLEVLDGSLYSTPSAAAKAVSGSGAGLQVWKRSSDGLSLKDIFAKYRTLVLGNS